MKVSASPNGPSSRALPSSTMLTSPLAPSSRKQSGNKRSQPVVNQRQGVEYGESSDEAFEPVRQDTARKGRRAPLGPPITIDEQMKCLSEEHRVCVQHFVDAAKEKDEKVRNAKSLRSPMFTDRDFRGMAINWTSTQEEMLQIPGINPDSVQRWGSQFYGLIKKFHKNFEEMVGSDGDVDMDENHRNVIDLIDLVSDEDDLDGGEYGEDDDDNGSLTEAPSKYFPPVPPNVQEYNNMMDAAESNPQLHRPRKDPPKKGARGGFKGQSKFRGSKKSSLRRSTSSSGAGSNRSGVSKKTQSRKTSGASRKSTSSRGGAKDSALMRSFGNQSGGSGIGMMPT
jgi:bloom syndrome protein